MYQTIFPIEQFHNQETPFYYYDLHLLEETLKDLKETSDYPDFKVHYAIKANSNPRILKIISAYGFGADTVSSGEIIRAIETGFPASEIVFAGVGKTDKEIILALESGVGCINVESAEELDIINELAVGMNRKAPVAMRINPEIDAHTHHYITTGLAENKFGISLSSLDGVLEKCLEYKGIDFKGFHFHIGSQVTDLTPYRILCKRINAIQDKYPDLSIQSINVGGGLGIDYGKPDENPIPPFKEFFQIFKNHLNLRPHQELHFELGRAIVAQCGSLISRAVYVKKGEEKKFIILDAGMTELIRPALYQAYHKIQNLTSKSDIEERYDVVGPICESSDTFAVDEILPLTRRGDFFAIRSAGAYGEAMASTYNMRPMPPSVFGK